jgi:mannan endo-1,4-beta-mannosidase
MTDGRRGTVFTDRPRAGRHRHGSPRVPSTPVRRHRARWAAAIGGAVAAVAIVAGLALPALERSADPPHGYSALPTTPGSYIGLYPAGAPYSIAAADAFARATGVAPDVITYYSGWLERFQSRFAAAVTRRGAVPLVQIDPTGVNLAAIAAGHYDFYLDAYAHAVRAYGHPVIVSFGHEMNADWYSWGYGHASPRAFIAAWRHIVTVFRARGASNVTWLWTPNVIHSEPGVAPPGPWWPGSSYVTWVGLDGYYYNSSQTFPSLFGPTIAAVRGRTGDPILIAETSAAPAAGQAAKISDLFAGIRLYGLLGFVWFDSAHQEDWRLNSPSAIAAFRRAAKDYHNPAS